LLSWDLRSGTRPDWPGGRPAVNHPRVQVPECARSSPEDGPFPDGDPGSDECLRRDPDVVADGDWQTEQRHVGPGVVVCSGAQVRVLADRHTLSERHRPEVVDDREIPECGVVVHAQQPWNLDPGGWTDDAATSDSGAEQAK